MTTELKVFEFEPGTPLRVFGTWESPMFAGVDVCRIAGHTNHRDALARVNPEDKGVVSTDTPGGIQELVVLTEGGLYDFVLSCRRRRNNPNGARLESFKRWVTHEVLPSIRRTGQYAMPGAAPDLSASAALARVEARLDALESRDAERARQDAARDDKIDRLTDAITSLVLSLKHIGTQHLAGALPSPEAPEGRTNAEKRRAVEVILASPIAAGLTNVKVAELACVSPGLVADVRAEFLANPRPLPRPSLADKRKAVEAALRNPTLAGRSNRRIARAVGVSHPFVGEVRREFEVGPGERN